MAEVRQLVVSFNERMTEVFNPAWVSCLDESMSVWTSKFSCRSWMDLALFQENHIQWGTNTTPSAVVRLYQLELVEVKDRPVDHSHTKILLGGKTIGLLLLASYIAHPYKKWMLCCLGC